MIWYTTVWTIIWKVRNDRFYAKGDKDVKEVVDDTKVFFVEVGFE